MKLFNYFYFLTSLLMDNQFTEVTTHSWGSRIMGSIGGILFGFVLFIASFALLYWNEGRINLATIAEKAIQINTHTKPPQEADQQLISLTGVLKSSETLGDTFLKKGKYIGLHRNVEMYSWVEEKRTESQTNTGGSETTKTTYSYKKQWTPSPSDSSYFKHSEGHTNPQIPISPNFFVVQKIQLETYAIDTSTVELPAYRDVTLNKQNVILTDGVELANNEYLFKGDGTIANPQIGDIKIYYTAIANPLDTATIFGTLDSTDQKISPFYSPNNTKLYRIFEGTRQSAIATMDSEYTFLTWLLRIAGFAMMWFGLAMLFGPISTFLDVLPIFGSITRVLVGVVTFLVALILSFVTIVISLIAHNVIALIISLLVIIGGIIWYMKHRSKSINRTTV